MAYESVGSGDAVLLCRGAGVAGSGWRPQVEALAPRWRTITFDTRGFGASTAGTSPMSIEALAADALAVLDALGVERAHLRSSLLLALSLSILACGDAGAPAATPATPAASPPTPAAAAPVVTPAVAAPAAPVVPTLPAPTIPAEWPTSMDDMTVDGVHVTGVHATCGLFEIMAAVQAVARTGAACPALPTTTVAVTLDGARATALTVSGPAAACVDAAMHADIAAPSCTLELTFAEAAAAR